MTHLAAHSSTTLRVTLSRTSVEVASVVFELVKADGQMVAQSGPIPVADRIASWAWTPNTPTSKTLADDVDTVVVTPRARYTSNGIEMTRDLPDITVFRDRVNIKVVADINGARENVTDARVRLVAHRPGLTRRQELGSVLTNTTGVAAFEGILQWTSIDVVVKTPWQLANDRNPYVTGKDKGLDREVLVEPKTYLASFAGIKVDDTDEFVPVAAVDGVRKQYVNFDKFLPDQDTMYPGENASYFGHCIKLQLAPSENRDEFAGERIFIKFKPNPGNGPRNDPAPRLVGADESGIAELRLGDDGTAVATVELGLAGGDRFELQVCSARKFSTVPDQEFEIVTWRRVYYELIAPQAMMSMLEQVTLHEREGAGPHYHFKASIQEQLCKTLDPVFLEYRLAHSLVFPDSELPSPTMLVSPTFFGKPPGRMWVIGSTRTVDEDLAHPYTRLKGPRVGGLRLVDQLFEPYLKSYTQTITTTERQIVFGTADERSHIVPDAEALRGNSPHELHKANSIQSLTWRAKVDITLPENEHHPAKNSWKKFFQDLDKESLTIESSQRIVVNLPTGPDKPGSFVGSLGPSTCPIEVRITLGTVSPLGGSNSVGAMTVKLGSRDDHNAFALCHELGHSMKLGQLADKGMRAPPPGLPTAKHVDQGGNYYTESGGEDGRRPHGKGPHCASGLPDMTIKTYPIEPGPEVCVMFGYAPKRDNPNTGEPHQFCAQCQLYLKGMDLRQLT